ncbi:MAG TPA: hypothetical protein VKE74_01290 [Gemmataceae bacterium]|nr:hypothetical protein [Gemmataceae bacterium]
MVEWPRGQSGVGLWLFALRTVLVGSGPMNWYFEPTGGEGVVLMVFKRAEKK